MLKSVHGKTPIERRRTLITWLLAPAWLAILIATQPKGFETLGYSLIEFSGFFLVFGAVLGRLWCTLYIGGRKDQKLCQSGPYSLRVGFETHADRASRRMSSMAEAA